MNQDFLDLLSALCALPPQIPLERVHRKIEKIRKVEGEAARGVPGLGVGRATLHPCPLAFSARSRTSAGWPTRSECSRHARSRRTPCGCCELAPPRASRTARASTSWCSPRRRRIARHDVRPGPSLSGSPGALLGAGASRRHAQGPRVYRDKRGGQGAGRAVRLRRADRPRREGRARRTRQPSSPPNGGPSEGWEIASPAVGSKRQVRPKPWLRNPAEAEVRLDDATIAVMGSFAPIDRAAMAAARSRDRPRRAPR
jgi:hypothetical protein